MIDVYDFLNLCTDDGNMVHIYDMNPAVENEVFTGTIADATCGPWSDYEVLSFDLDPRGAVAVLILNIDTSEG